MARNRSAAQDIEAGQSCRYIYVQLKDFKEGHRSDPLMLPMAQALSRQVMIDLGNFYAAQKVKPSSLIADETSLCNCAISKREPAPTTLAT